MTIPSLVLASSSPYKRRLMRRLGIEFDSVSPEIDESRLDGESPTEMACRLAEAKAMTIRQRRPDAWVIGADQIAASGDRVFGKPGGRDEAISQLEQLEGTTHQLITAVALSHRDKAADVSVTTYDMVMRPLTPDQIRRYVDEDTPFDCAGSYKIEQAGIRLFEATRGDDPTAIEGLPLTRVWTLLLEAGERSAG